MNRKPHRRINPIPHFMLRESRYNFATVYPKLGVIFIIKVQMREKTTE